jgi:hypothetical protein
MAQTKPTAIAKRLLDRTEERLGLVTDAESYNALRQAFADEISKAMRAPKLKRIKSFSKKEMRRFHAEFSKLGNDDARWHWLVEHRHVPFTVYCDNDSTSVQFGDQDVEFDHYIGWSDGVMILLNAVGIHAECV